MLSSLRRRLTYGNVTGTVAIFIALGGGAAAIGGVGAHHDYGVINADGEIKACYDKRGPDRGEVRLLVKGRCTRGERKVRWSQQGPPGEPGHPGTQGQPGSARAYGRVLVGSSSCASVTPGTPCALSKSKGITAVVRGSAEGTYCVTAPGLSQGSLPAFAAVDGGNSPINASLTALMDERSPSPFCAADQFAVLTYADFEDAVGTGPGLRGDIGFTILIP